MMWMRDVSTRLFVTQKTKRVFLHSQSWFMRVFSPWTIAIAMLARFIVGNSFVVRSSWTFLSRSSLLLHSLAECKLDGALELHSSGLTPFRIDFLAKNSARRMKDAKSELCVRAIGQCDVVIDMTAGLGRDSFMFAAAGLNVIMMERNPFIHSLLNDALRRLSASDMSLSQRMNLLPCSSANVAIEDIRKAVNGLKPSEPGLRPLKVAVYLDPMYPTPSADRSAKSKKGTQILQLLTEADSAHEDEDTRLKSAAENEVALFSSAKQLATTRIVIKRGLRDRPLITSLDNSSVQARFSSITGSTQRFDIFGITQSF